MLFTDIIRKKRDGHALNETEIRRFVTGLTDNSIPAEQVSALAMAILLNSMSFAESATLTRAMAESGTTLSWDADQLGGPVVDKHSTGGVGDKVSLILAPLVAACGGFVPMISGRGLGHSGGTLDKMSSIPGYQLVPDLELFRRTVASTGCAIIGQTAELAPADKRLYAIRDVTATVESVPLITASILSKKIAAGNHGLVMDIKWGSGAFMATLDDARELAQSIIGTATNAGLKTHAVITDMNEVLGNSAGNSLETREAARYLLGIEREPRLHEVVISLAVEMLLLSGIETDSAKAKIKAIAVLDAGDAAERFSKMVATLGGPTDFLQRYEHYLTSAPVTVTVVPENRGYLAAVDARAIGNAIIDLGGGRRRQDDQLDLSVGFSEVAAIGGEVGPGAPLATVHARSTEDADHARNNILAACTIAANPPAPRTLINAVMTPAEPNG